MYRGSVSPAPPPYPRPLLSRDLQGGCPKEQTARPPPAREATPLSQSNRVRTQAGHCGGAAGLGFFGWLGCFMFMFYFLLLKFSHTNESRRSRITDPHLRLTSFSHTQYRAGLIPSIPLTHFLHTGYCGAPARVPVSPSVNTSGPVDL